MKLRNALFALTFATTCGADLAFAHSFSQGEIAIEHPWTFTTPPGAKVAGAFMVLHNKGKAGDKLLSAQSTIAGTTELHTHTMDNGIMRMRAVPAIDLPSGATVTLKPGSFHVMFFDLKRPLVKGEKIPLTLNFEKSGVTTVEIAVEDRGDKAVHSHGDHKH